MKSFFYKIFTAVIDIILFIPIFVCFLCLLFDFDIELIKSGS